jgi:tellurite resistance protein TerC
LNIELWVWAATIAAFTLVLGADLVYQWRNPHEPTFKESAIWSSIYMGLALLFTLVVWGVWGSQYAGEYLAGFITEKSLSVDNLFVFLIIFTRFAVPRRLQSQALIVGIAIALVMRGLFIAAGAAVISAFSWAFYIFGAFLIYTAIKLMLETLGDNEGHEIEKEPGAGIKGFVGKFLPSTEQYHGTKLFIRENGRRIATPLFMVMLTIGFTDLLFALDSIPAIYGLTKEPYIVFVANAFALLGLRQLYFLLSGLMERLKYLGVGLSIILGWIGVKLVIHALNKNELPFLNGGEYITLVPEIPTLLSLGVILLTLVVTIIWSLAATRSANGAETQAESKTESKTENKTEHKAD